MWFRSYAGILIAAAIAVIPAALVFLFNAPGGEVVSGAGYAALILDESADERAVCAALERGKIRGAAAASTQNAFLNTFSGIEAVPLDRWFERVESFDPRNDGYAEKARALFISGGERRVFIPAAELTGWGDGAPRARLEALLGSPVKLVFQNYRRDTAPAFIIFAFCAFLFLFLAQRVAAMTGDRFLLWYAALLLPALSVFASSGGGGFAASAVLLALFQLLRTPLQRFLTGLRYENDTAAEHLRTLFQSVRLSRFLREVFPELHKIIALAALYAGICAAAPLSVFTALMGLLCFTLSFCAAAAAEASRGRAHAHIRYVFVPILSRVRRSKKFPALPLPFLAAVFAAVIVSALSPAAVLESAGADFMPAAGEVPSRADYEKHLAFQKQFAYHKLAAAADGAVNEAESYLHYTLDESELITAGAPEEKPPAFPDSAAWNETARWQLEPLAAFLRRGAPAPSATARTAGGELIALILALCLYLPFILSARFIRRRGVLPSEITV